MIPMEFTPSGDPMPVDAYMRLYHPLDDEHDERSLDDEDEPCYIVGHRRR
jgi:hypothetical protein